MANTRQNSGKAKPGPKPPIPGSRKGNRTQSQNSTAKNDGVYHSEPETTATNTELEKPHKARGCPKKATIANTPTVKMNKRPAPTNATTHKHIWDDIASVDEEGSQRVSKHTKANETSVDKLPPPQGTTGGLRKAAEVTPRDPLPSHKGHNIHPVPNGTTCCPSKEVAAEREAKARELNRKIKELEAEKCYLA